MVRRTVRVLAVSFAATTLILTPLVHAAEPTAGPVHVVEPGDTLWQIALDAGTDAATIMRLNGLEDGDLLAVGQSLKVPVGQSAPAKPPAAKYTVADGDTLSSIAVQLNTTTDALLEANHLEDANRLVVGQELSVPGGSVVPAPVARPAASSSAASSTTAAPVRVSSSKRILVPYTVQSGETLGQIARQFDVRADAIAQASGIDDPNRIGVSAVLKVPLPGYEHVVTEGETLRDIAARERVDLGSLIDFNEIEDPGLIRVGQIVLVPAPSPGLQAANLAPPAPAPAPAAPKPAASAPPAAAPPAGARKPAVAPAAAPPKPAPAPAVAPPAGAPRDSVAGAALKLLGAPYVWGGSSPSGFDCSGLVWYAVRQAGKAIGRGMLGEYNSGSHPSRDELKAGDLVFFQNTYTPGLSHNGIYIGNGQFVHAADEQSGVTTSSLSSGYWASRWFGATRLP
jgi:cell wall-associated NlpC family hydrolase/nucleoid-associated protein YgaU